MEHILKEYKDLGLQQMVMDALPYAVVGGEWEGSFLATATSATILNHIVPTGRQLKILFLRVWTQEEDGAVFRIYQTNPTATGATGTTEAYPVVGSVPSGDRDYPMLEGAGAETLRGSLIDPVHVLEGSIIFEILRTPNPATGSRYCVVWWGVQKIPE